MAMREGQETKSENKLRWNSHADAGTKLRNHRIEEIKGMEGVKRGEKKTNFIEQCRKDGCVPGKRTTSFSLVPSFGRQHSLVSGAGLHLTCCNN